jgi:methionine biosynthesis protein MetW
MGIWREWRNDLRLFGNLFLDTPEIKEAGQDYDAYWKKKRASGTLGNPGIFQLHRIRWIMPRISEGDTVAEFGCGDAATLLWLRDRKKIHPIGLDVSEHALSHATGKGIETHKLEYGTTDYSSLPEADVYLLLEVLEHLPDPESVLKQILKKTRRKVIISVPNTGYFPYRLRLLSGRFPVQWRVHPGEHLRFWTLRDFHWWLGQLGLVEMSETFGYKGVPFLNRMLPNLFAMGILCEIKK